MLAAAAILVAAAGCAADTPVDAAPTSHDNVTGVEKSIETWALPLDPFVLTDKMIKKSNYAAALVIADCLDERGTPLPVPYVDFDSAYEGRETTRTTLTEAIASEYGYHLPQEIIPAQVMAWEAYRTADIGSVMETASDECGMSLQAKIPGYSSEMMNFSSMFVGSSYEGALLDPAVQDAASEWKTCMAPAAIEDLPDLPTDMPSASIRARFTTSPTTGDDPTPSEITREEVQLALTDYACRESSGYQQAFYDALWEREANAYEQNAEAFDAMLDKIGQMSERIDATITEFATGA